MRDVGRFDYHGLQPQRLRRGLSIQGLHGIFFLDLVEQLHLDGEHTTHQGLHQRDLEDEARPLAKQPAPVHAETSQVHAGGACAEDDP
eukprot:282428-Pyramimonas_sp.AAC.1